MEGERELGLVAQGVTRASAWCGRTNSWGSSRVNALGEEKVPGLVREGRGCWEGEERVREEWQMV